MALCTDAKIFDKVKGSCIAFMQCSEGGMGFPENKCTRFQALVKQYWKQN